jgi:hypothetical protein
MTNEDQKIVALFDNDILTQKALVNVKDQINIDPIRALLAIHSVLGCDTLEQKVKVLHNVIKDIELREEAIEKDEGLTTWGGMVSTGLSLLSISGLSVLNPLVGVSLVATAVIGTAVTVGSSVLLHKQNKDLEDKIQRLRLALQSEALLNWACVWGLVGADLFVDALTSASRGEVVENRILVTFSGKEPIDTALTLIAESQGVTFEHVLSRLKEIKEGTRQQMEARIETSAKTVLQGQNIPALSASVPIAEPMAIVNNAQIETKLVSFEQEIPDLIASVSAKLKNSLIIGVPGVGKGIFVSNALEAIKGKATVFYIDPKDDPKETGYFKGRVHNLYRNNIAIAEPEETYEWVKNCLAEYDNFDAGTGFKLLVFDELAAVIGMLQNVKGAEKWLTSKLNAYASSGSSRGIVVWGISQNAHVSGIGLNGGQRSIFTPIIMINGEELAASEQILAAQIIPSDKRLNSSEIQTICAKSPINRAIFHGKLNQWFPMPVMPNFCGFDRDSRTFIEPQIEQKTVIQDAASTRIIEEKPEQFTEKTLDSVEDTVKDKTVFDGDSRENDLSFVIAASNIAKNHLLQNEWVEFDLYKLRKVNKFKSLSPTGKPPSTKEIKAVTTILKYSGFLIETSEDNFKVVSLFD